MMGEAELGWRLYELGITDAYSHASCYAWVDTGLWEKLDLYYPLTGDEPGKNILPMLEEVAAYYDKLHNLH